MDYDCLPHELIIAKPDAYGFYSTSLKLFHNYFSNQKQRVKIGSAISGWRNILTGIPQGCILDPLIFNIFLTISLSLLKKLTFATLQMIILFANLVQNCQ